jgi:hypothetical protein
MLASLNKNEIGRDNDVSSVKLVNNEKDAFEIYFFGKLQILGSNKGNLRVNFSWPKVRVMKI